MKRYVHLCWLVVALVVAGCSDGRPDRVPISGQVLIDGKPVPYGSIRFVPDNARPALGKLDGEGRFTLSCFEKGDGAVVGENKVVVRADEPLGGLKVRWHAPKKYAELDTTDIVQVVTERDDSLVINLTWDGGKPFVEVVEGSAAGEAEEGLRYGKRREGAEAGSAE